jgi:hypothetical protein
MYVQAGAEGEAGAGDALHGGLLLLLLQLQRRMSTVRKRMPLRSSRIRSMRQRSKSMREQLQGRQMQPEAAGVVAGGVAGGVARHLPARCSLLLLSLMQSRGCLWVGQMRKRRRAKGRRRRHMRAQTWRVCQKTRRIGACQLHQLPPTPPHPQPGPLAAG